MRRFLQKNDRGILHRINRNQSRAADMAVIPNKGKAQYER